MRLSEFGQRGGCIRCASGATYYSKTALKQKIHSTEVGVERALSLGLDASHPILQQASAYILGIMQGDIEFPVMERDHKGGMSNAQDKATTCVGW